MGHQSRARVERRERGRRLGIAMEKYPQLRPPDVMTLAPLYRRPNVWFGGLLLLAFGMAAEMRLHVIDWCAARGAGAAHAVTRWIAR